MADIATTRALIIAAALASAPTLGAQQAPDKAKHTFSFGTAFGMTVPMSNVFGTLAVGPHLQLTGVWDHSPRTAVRVDGIVQMLSGAVAEPDCLPGPCKAVALHPDQVYAATLSAEWRPFRTASRVFALGGSGLYYARGPASTDFGVGIGVSGGAGLDLASREHSGFAIETRLHVLPRSLGSLTGLFTSSIGYRFR